MGGIPSEKDAAHLISLRLTAVDTVVHAPDGITQHATRRPHIEYRLEVLEGWLPQRRMISLGWADIGSDGRASDWKLPRDQHAFFFAPEGMLAFFPLPRGHLPS
jgi:hypothetical protein